ncbi:uncharacterized protein LOC127876232 [Dreissena polymorpha]|uniref:B box-type domain-containing protein n=1 Tax=Dreissena polymorpha TaxID=45954 RepID=A0A9D4QNR5_DREPO|nr:uncharacterized protein LOC127876232 [Dreissena polymorpha]KAH3837779.1 hypothetical protein DPMN_111180 [Dreissena polymorpha]
MEVTVNNTAGENCDENQNHEEKIERKSCLKTVKSNGIPNEIKCDLFRQQTVCIGSNWQVKPRSLEEKDQERRHVKFDVRDPCTSSSSSLSSVESDPEPLPEYREPSGEYTPMHLTNLGPRVVLNNTKELTSGESKSRQVTHDKNSRQLKNVTSENTKTGKVEEIIRSLESKSDTPIDDGYHKPQQSVKFKTTESHMKDGVNSPPVSNDADNSKKDHSIMKVTFSIKAEGMIKESENTDEKTSEHKARTEENREEDLVDGAMIPPVTVHFCSPCARQGKFQIAIHVCDECGTRGSYICAQCKSHHEKFMELSGHNIHCIMDGSCCKSDSETSRHGEHTTESCPYKLIQDLIDSYDRAKVSIQCVKVKREEDQKRLQANRDRIHTTIQEIRIKIIEQLDQLEEQASSELDRRFHRGQDRIEQDMECLENLSMNWERVMQKYCASDEIIDSEKFRMAMKECEDLNTNGDKVINRIRHTLSSEQQLNFVKDIKLVDDTIDLNSFGSFVEASIQECYAAFHSEHEIRDDFDDEDCDITACCVLPDGTVLLTDSANAKVKKLDNWYKVDSSIVMPEKPCAMCVTDDHEVAVTIPKIKTVQFIDTNHDMRLNGDIDVGFPCMSVSCNKGLIFVAFDWPKQISVFNRKGERVNEFRKYTPIPTEVKHKETKVKKVIKTKTKTMERNNKGVDEQPNSKSEDAEMKNRKGGKLLQLPFLKSKKNISDKDKENIFEMIEEILIDHNSETIYACDKVKGLIMIEEGGNTVTHIKHFKNFPLFSAIRICKGKMSDFFVYGKSQRTNKFAIFHIEREKSVRILEGDGDFEADLIDVEAMCYDPLTSRMILTRAGHSIISVFEVT